MFLRSGAKFICNLVVFLDVVIDYSAEFTVVSAVFFAKLLNTHIRNDLYVLTLPSLWSLSISGDLFLC